MSRLNIGFRLRRLLKTIFANMFSAVIVNGAKTSYFHLEKSIRQGDKVSMTCFLLAIEPLANIIRRDNRIHKVILPNTKPKALAQYCDDTTVMSTDTRDISVIKEHISTFEKGSSAYFNPDKSEILMIGNWTHEQMKNLREQNIKRNMKILGVWFGVDANELNRQKIIEKLDEILCFWKSIPLTFAGKRLIISTKILPQLYHIIRITGMDAHLEKEVQRRITEFIWHPKKMYMLPYSVLQNSIDNGGQDMPNLQVINKAILTERISKILTSDRTWRGLFIYRLGFALRDIEREFASTKYSHTLTQSSISRIIINTYRELKHKIDDWKDADFKTLKKVLKHSNEYRKATPRRDYSRTWKEINTSTDNRRRKDIAYLIAHNALPVGAVLKDRNVTNNALCRLCGKNTETREHLFVNCETTQGVRKILHKRLGRTISEEEMIYHEGRAKMKKREKNMIAALKQTIWQIRAKLFYGEIRNNDICSHLKMTFQSKLE